MTSRVGHPALITVRFVRDKADKVVRLDQSNPMLRNVAFKRAVTSYY
jgi:hypothetical protein